MHPRDLPFGAALACAFAVCTPCQEPPAAGARTAIHRSAGLFELAPGVLHGGGAAYDVRFDAAGIRFEPALGAAVATTQHLRLTPVSVAREGTATIALPSLAAPRRAARTAVFDHADGVEERFAVGPDAVALSWRFDRRPAGRGDLVVRYAVDCGMPGPTTVADGGLGFGLPGIGGVTIGAVTGVDANGRTAVGTLRGEATWLELSLPADFVDGAAYPLVLDPLIGTKFDVWGGTSYDDAAPDVSYEKTEDRYLVTFLRTFSSGDVRVRGQLVDGDGALFQGVIWITTGGLSSRPRVASCSRQARFGVVWAQNVGTQTLVFFRSVSSLGGPTSMSPTSTIASSTQWTIADVDLGAEAGAFQQDHAFVAVWDDLNDGRIYARRIGIDGTGATVLHPGYTVFADAGLNSWSQPAIARAAAADGKLMVVARRYAGIGPQRGITSALVSARDDSVTSVTTIAMDSAGEYWRPDVDGYGSEWVVAWRANTLGSSANGVAARSARLVGGALQLGPQVSLGGTSLAQADYPSVGYSHGKTWLGWYDTVFGVTALRARGIDSTSCASCQDQFGEPVPAGNTRIVVATTMSGHDVARDRALIVWSESLDVWAQVAANHADTGAVTHLGGGCGAGGAPNVRAPSIGMSRIPASVTGLSPTALLSVFNLTVSPTYFTCGPCEWLPFSIPIVVPVGSFQSASVTYMLPCDPLLVGVQFQTQWTTFDPAAATCAPVPGFVVSDRWLHTIGQ